ncbi:MAG: hypothetical protein ACRD2J_02740 [Thermoanaerobaculia bacterium]
MSAISCSLPRAAMTSVAAQLETNLLMVEATVGGLDGTFLIGTAHPATVLDDELAVSSGRRGRVHVRLGNRFSARVRPERADLGGIADGILGADLWRDRSLTIDYVKGLVTIGNDADPLMEGLRQSFELVPRVPILVDGAEVSAVVDTANPDTILLPQATFGEPGRRRVDLQVGVTRIPGVDARVAPIDEVRLGNRILSRFLVTIDYANREVALWPYPR